MVQIKFIDNKFVFIYDVIPKYDIVITIEKDMDGEYRLTYTDMEIMMLLENNDDSDILRDILYDEYSYVKIIPK